MLNFPIVDTHLHLWDPKKLRYPWLDEIPLLNKPYLLSDYNDAVGSHQVDKTVFLQCECDPSQYKQEAQWVTELAQTDPRIEGIVPWAPLEKGDGAREELEALAQNKLIKGIRRIIQFEPSVEFCLQPDFVRGVQMLADFDFHYEICIKGDEQFANTIKLVQQCPNVRFILNHIGKPFIAASITEPWQTYVKELAALPNAWCKMSGVTTEADTDAWTPEDLQPYIDGVIQHFGWDRLIFGGDWPVVLLAGEYPGWVETLNAAIDGCSETEKRKLFRDNAIAFYQLG